MATNFGGQITCAPLTPSPTTQQVPVYESPPASSCATPPGQNDDDTGTTNQTAQQQQASPTPSVIEVPAEEDEDDELYSQDPMCMVMDLLNIEVVSKKPGSIYDTPPPLGEMIPRSYYIEEKTAMRDIIKEKQQEVIRAQMGKLKEQLKVKDLEGKMDKVARVVGEMHQLYGRFLRSMVNMMRCKGKEIRMGPFDDKGDAQSVFQLLNRMVSQFESEVGSLRQARCVLGEVIVCLEEKAKKRVQTQTRETTVPLTPPEPSIPQTSSTSGCIRRSSLGEVPTATIHHLSQQQVPQVIQAISNPVLPPLNTAPTPVAATTSAAPDQDNASAFIPVLDPEKTRLLPNGQVWYDLVEYPRSSSVVRKKHEVDKDKCRAGLGWFCTCGMSFQNTSLLKYHIRYFSAQWKFMCTLCSRKYPGMNFLKLHMVRTHQIMFDQGGTPTNSGMEGFAVSGQEGEIGGDQSTSVATTSSASQNTESTTSTSAGPSSATTEPIQKSTLVVNGTRCACGLELHSKDKLIAHIRQEVESLGQFFQCTMCQNTTFDHPCNLKSHLREKHGLEWQNYHERKYGCSVCEKTFGALKELETHVERDHTMQQNQDGGDGGVTILEQNLLASYSFGDNLDIGENTLTFHVDATGSNLKAGNSNTGMVQLGSLDAVRAVSAVVVEPPVYTIDDD